LIWKRIYDFTVAGNALTLMKKCRVVGKGSKLIGSGSAVPSLTISNDDLSKVVETSDEWIATRTGIRSRRVLSGTFDSLFSLFH
jgi:3-oxoacyl-[acyl-carrier-protein] synthase-3